MGMLWECVEKWAQNGEVRKLAVGSYNGAMGFKLNLDEIIEIGEM